MRFFTTVYAGNNVQVGDAVTFGRYSDEWADEPFYDTLEKAIQAQSSLQGDIATDIVECEVVPDTSWLDVLYAAASQDSNGFDATVLQVFRTKLSVWDVSMDTFRKVYRVVDGQVKDEIAFMDLRDRDYYTLVDPIEAGVEQVEDGKTYYRAVGDPYLVEGVPSIMSDGGWPVGTLPD